MKKKQGPSLSALNQMDEVWKEIPNTYGKYSVSTFGRVKRNIMEEYRPDGIMVRKYRHEKILSIVRKPCGDSVSLYVNGKVIMRTIRNLVIEAFRPDLEKHMFSYDLYYKDGNPSNNHYLNIGKRRRGTKLTYGQVMYIKSELALGNKTMRGLAKQFKVDHKLIVKIAKGERWGWVKVTVNFPESLERNFNDRPEDHTGGVSQ